MKRCSNPKCKNPLKPESEFSIDNGRSDGLFTWCKECVKEYDRKRKHIRRDKRLESEYGFFPGEFEKISKSQDHKCLICKQVKELDVDHCHITNKFRGLLCRNCNTNLGWYEMHPVQEYLNKPEWKFLLVWLSTRNRRDWQLRRDYLICLDDYEMMFEIQNGVCGICHMVCAAERDLSTDHNHKTLRVRGLLCYRCNINLGWYDKYPVQEYLND